MKEVKNRIETDLGRVLALVDMTWLHQATNKAMKKACFSLSSSVKLRIS